MKKPVKAIALIAIGVASLSAFSLGQEPAGARAVTGMNLTNGSSSSSGSSFTTASVTPAAQSLVIVTVSTPDGGVPGVSGLDLSWTQSVATIADGAGKERITVATAMTGTSPASGPVTISFDSSQGNAVWSVEQFIGANEVVPQTVSALQTSPSSGITVSVPHALTSTRSVLYGAALLDTNATVTRGNASPGASNGSSYMALSELSNLLTGSPAGFETAWGTNITSMQWVWGSSSAVSDALALEISAAPEIPSPSPGLLSVNGITNHDTSDLSTVSAGGFGWIRADTGWNVIEPSVQGQYVFTSIDDMYNAANAAGLKVLWILDYANALYADPNNSGGAPYDAYAMNGFKNFAAALAAHLPRGSSFEIENEWASGCIGNFTAQQMATLSNLTSAAVHQIDPTAVVISGSPCGGIDTTDELLFIQNGGANGLDGMAAHTYDASATGSAPPEATLSNRAWGLAANSPWEVNKVSNGVAVPTYWTEGGVTLADVGNDAAAQAIWIVRYALIGLAGSESLRTPLNFLYDKDDTTGGDWSWIDNSYSVSASTAMDRVLANCRVTGSALNADASGINLVNFSCPGNARKTAIWANGPDVSTSQFPTGTQCYDWMGNGFTITNPYTITGTANDGGPIYCNDPEQTHVWTVQDSSGYNVTTASSITVDFGTNVTGGDQLLVAESTSSGEALGTPTDSQGNTYTQLAMSSSPGQSVAAIYLATAKASGADSVICPISIANDIACHIYEVGGSSGVVDQTGTSIQTGATLSVSTSQATTTTDDYVLAYFTDVSSNWEAAVFSPMPGWGDWEQSEDYCNITCGSNAAFSEDTVATTQGVQTATVTTSNPADTYINLIVALKPR